MAASKIFDIMTDSFLDGITGAALFGKLRRPGAPTVFVDTRSFDEANQKYDVLSKAASTSEAGPLYSLDVTHEQNAANVQIEKLYREYVLNEKPLEGTLGEIQIKKMEAKALHGQRASFSRSKP